MSEKLLKIGTRVEVREKSVRGTIAFMGMTSFAPGKWVGVILDEPRGKNNGTIRGVPYFTCPDNYGTFVRPNFLTIVDAVNGSTSLESDDGFGSPAATPSVSVAATPSNEESSLSRRGRLGSSRLSLAGSRQSLLGSRSQLASPATEKPSTIVPMTPILMTQSDKLSPEKAEKRTTISPPESLVASKRASFVETGFLETLKPQFTPGQSLTSPAPTAEDKLNAMQQAQEIEDLRNQLKEVTEKLEIVRARRADDKERIRDFDKMKTQFEQLQEFKSKIMEAQSSLQRDLQRAKQETKDAIEARDRHIEEMAELTENVEMITLDKEMAEEKADTLQLELDTAKESIEELTLDLELLQSELQNKAESNTMTPNMENGVGLTSYELKQLNQQNARLRDTLVRLRDLSAHDKHEIQKQQKELHMKKSEVAELQRTKEKLSAKIDDLEAQVVDLQEQVDAALGAEEMVEQLAEKKMELDDKVKLLEEEVAELEALEEVHEQLVESNHELEMDLREELEMAVVAKRECVREKDAALETILDRDQTILKFRELVQRLNEQLQELRERANQENVKPSKDSSLTETIDFKQMFAESKAYTRAIDLQLRQIELSQTNEHVRMLTAYMPETFMNRGGDHDAILVILLISRIVFKSGIIVNQTRERFPAASSIDRNEILQGHTVHQFAFRSRLLHHVHNLQAVMHQFLYGLNVCKPEVLLKTGACLPEMVAQEKIIDGVIEMLKANQLDENSSTENLEKCIAFFNAMFAVLLGNENLMNETQLVRDCVASITAACDSVATDAVIMQTLIQGGDETSDSGLLLQYVVQNTESVKQHMKLIKRRLPQDAVKCGLSSNTITNLKQTSDNLGKAMALLFNASKQVLHGVVIEEDTDVTISHVSLWEHLSSACEKVYEQDDRGPSQNLRTVLSTTNIDMKQLAEYLHDHEYEIVSTNTAAAAGDMKAVAPIVLRAQFIKKQLEETKTLTSTLENREYEIKQLKLAAKNKQDELSEMQIRKNLAEKKLSVLQNDVEINTDKLQRKYEEAVQKLKKKEKEFEETMDHLQNDIDSLESERGALREKLKGYSSKKGDLKSSTAFDITASSPYIAQELTLLKKAFADEREERIKLQAQESIKLLTRLEPLYVPQAKDSRVNELEKDLDDVKFNYAMSMFDPSKTLSGRTCDTNIQKLLNNHRNEQQLHRMNVKAKAEQLASVVWQEYLDRKPHRSAPGDHSIFPTVETLRAMKI